MQNKIMQIPSAQCFLVEVIARNGQNTPWIISLNSNQISDERIQKVVFDKFYEIVTGEAQSFKNLCEKFK